MYSRFWRTTICCLWFAVNLHAADTPTKKSAKHHSKHGHSHKVRGQQKIDARRAHDIQSALIRNHYLNGTPSGTWDSESQRAMERFQADNGWQTKQIPDSRALIKLGLGPDQQHLLNPESAMTTPPAAHASTAAPAASATPSTSEPTAQN